MPVIKSAKKKLRQDKKRTIERAKTEEAVKEVIRKAVASPTAKTVSAAVSALDEAAKKHIFHKNKAARIKSRLAHLLSPKGAEKKETAKTATKPTVKAVKKAASSAKGRSSSGRKKSPAKKK